MSGWEIMESESVAIPAGGKKSMIKSCTPGKIVLTGGYRASDCDNCSVLKNYPTSNNSWEVSLENKSGSAVKQFQTYVVCAKFSNK